MSAPVKSFPALLKFHQAEIARALPRHLSADRMTRIALTEFRKNPKLSDCNPLSVFGAVVMASQLGLEIGVMGQAYLVPFKQECQLIIGVQGLLELVRRSGQIKRIEAQVVFEKDRFTYKTGLSTSLDHEPFFDGERGNPRLAYAVAEFSDGSYHVEVMSRTDIESIRDRSATVNAAKRFNKTTPWDTDTGEMWKKTVLRRLCKYLPRSTELANALKLEEAAARGGTQNLDVVSDVIEGSWAPVEVVEDVPAQEEPVTVIQEAKALSAQPHTTEILTKITEAKTMAQLADLSRGLARLKGDEKAVAITAWKAHQIELSGGENA